MAKLPTELARDGPPATSSAACVVAVLWLPATSAAGLTAAVRIPTWTRIHQKKEKLSHFRFYWHDVLSGKNPTSVMVIPPPGNSTTGFGYANMIDNPLTLRPELTSDCVGRAQGLYASASQQGIGFLMVMNFAFIEGKYNGSTLTVVGRNPAMDAVRELSVVGGSGLFRFARGYVQARTHWLDLETGDATVEYNAYVLHY
ncbi:unnamed protein product [Cuscuta campestris]|uniref:Dirigent protein n=1 Tax=Cuscuta campestris TaxID=132261 RepID=A0A484K8D2_9ASTE|nr:unnamed protein product [Cuscuta campestris]